VRRGGLGPAHVVAKEAGALWTPAPLGACFTEAEERRRRRAPTWPRGGGGPGRRAPAWARWRRNDIRTPAGKSAVGGWVIYGGSRSEPGARGCWLSPLTSIGPSSDDGS
jgi:hypothetical protein